MSGKLAIKPFRTPALMDVNSAQNSWKNLESAFNEIYKRNSSQLSFEFLYRYNIIFIIYFNFIYFHYFCLILNFLNFDYFF